MKIKSLSSDERGVIHHIGLVVVAVFVVGAIGFATTKVIANQSESNKSVTADVEGAIDDNNNTPDDVSQATSQDESEGASNDL